MVGCSYIFVKLLSIIVLKMMAMLDVFPLSYGFLESKILIGTDHVSVMIHCTTMVNSNIHDDIVSIIYKFI